MKKIKKSGKKVLGIPKLTLQNVEQMEERISPLTQNPPTLPSVSVSNNGGGSQVSPASPGSTSMFC